MTDLDLTRLRELHEKATPAPWFVSDTDSQWIVDDYGDAIADTEESRSSWTPSHDAALIAETRNALPALLAEVDRLTRQVDAVKALAESDHHADTCGAVLTPGADYPCSCWKAELLRILAAPSLQGGQGEVTMHRTPRIETVEDIKAGQVWQRRSSGQLVTIIKAPPSESLHHPGVRLHYQGERKQIKIARHFLREFTYVKDADAEKGADRG